MKFTFEQGDEVVLPKWVKGSSAGKITWVGVSGDKELVMVSFLYEGETTSAVFYAGNLLPLAWPSAPN